MLTSCIPNEDVIVKRRGNEKVVPLVINVYNNAIGGVDRSDQMMNSYPVERKRLKKWSKKMWLHLLNTCTFNSQILHNKHGGNLSPLQFRSKLVSQIIEKYGCDTESWQRGGRPSTSENPFRLVERHFPSYVPATNSKANASRRCIVCKKRSVRKESRCECLCCDIGLCAAPCFEWYHKLKGF